MSNRRAPVLELDQLSGPLLVPDPAGLLELATDGLVRDPLREITEQTGRQRRQRESPEVERVLREDERREGSEEHAFETDASRRLRRQRQ